MAKSQDSNINIHTVASNANSSSINRGLWPGMWISFGPKDASHSLG